VYKQDVCPVDHSINHKIIIQENVDDELKHHR
jgi:hypothetical protein